MFEPFGYGLQCSHGVPCDSDHLRHRDRSLDSAGHTFSAHAPLPVADLHDAVVAANRGNRRKDTVFGDAVETPALKLAATPSLSMQMRNDVARRHDDSVLATMTATPRVAPPQRHRCTR